MSHNWTPQPLKQRAALFGQISTHYTQTIYEWEFEIPHEKKTIKFQEVKGAPEI